MSWIALTETNVRTKLSGPELSALKTAALASGQTDPLPDIISQIVKEVRGYVAACARNKLGDGATIPDELEGAAISRIRFELATRLPIASLLTEDRRTANANALSLLRDVAVCRFLIVQPVTAAADQAAGGTSAELVSEGRDLAGSDLAGV
ncbi:MAG: hypothetical protein PHE83_05855 [Opitutaceae bacterium]|nr:hypothetical protein [Opitutaceae bacterium]